MKTYKDINGGSGVSAYKYGSDWIQVQFGHGNIYEYRASVIGSNHLNTMKELADSGDGLNTYINKNSEIKKGYSSKS